MRAYCWTGSVFLPACRSCRSYHRDLWMLLKVSRSTGSSCRAAIGYSFPFYDDEGTCLFLSGLLKSNFAAPLRYDITAKWQYQHLFRIGASYRKNDALGTALGLNITKYLLVGYMYEWGIDRRISAYSKGSHEICVGFRFLKQNQPGETRMGWQQPPHQTLLQL